jgi:probable phosphoglycerate mutase
MELIFIRHAEPDYENNTLTKKGFKEADILGQFLKNEKFDAMYVSTLNRAKYTADGILKYNNNFPVKYLDSIREFNELVDLPYIDQALTWDFGTRLLKDDKIYDKDKWREIDYLNVEKLHKRYQTNMQDFLKIIEEHGYKKDGNIFKVLKPNHDKIVFVCHFGIISYMLSVLLNLSPIALANFTVSRPTGITRLVSEERERGEAIFRLLEYGSTTHLYIKNEEPSFMARFCETFDDDTEHVD